MESQIKKSSRRGGLRAAAKGIQPSGFRHEALLYSNERDLIRRAAAFVEDGYEAGEPIMVALAPAKIDRLIPALDEKAGGVRFVDMTDAGRNPGRIGSLWRDFVAAHAGRRTRGIGEPIWAGRSGDEMIECQRHEAVLNLALEDASIWLVCPYEVATLDEEILAEARRSHPFVVARGVSRPSLTYRAAVPPRFDHPLPPSPATAETIAFRLAHLEEIRRLVRSRGRAFGLSDRRANDLVAAVNEATTNSVRHGGGGGSLRVWIAGDAIVCEVSDAGSLDDPLAGRRRPSTGSQRGRGLWLINQLCDLAQIRTFEDGTVVRVRMHRG